MASCRPSNTSRWTVALCVPSECVAPMLPVTRAMVAARLAHVSHASQSRCAVNVTENRARIVSADHSNDAKPRAP